MAKANMLRTIHAALTHPVARGILGSLSEEDMAVLAKHHQQGDLMHALRPLADEASSADAIAAMPRAVADVVGKIPPKFLQSFTTELKLVPREDDGSIPCTC